MARVVTLGIQNVDCFLHGIRQLYAIVDFTLQHLCIGKSGGCEDAIGYF